MLDALVIGAGPSGIGAALALGDVEDLFFGVLERGQVGQTFLDWPAQQTFLTPSFTGNGFGATDLNSIHPLTSPAFSLGVDYPDGPQYARYLNGVVEHFDIPVLEGAEVTDVRPGPDGFTVASSRGPVTARALIWAGGEFADPAPLDFPGAQRVVHSSAPEAWERRDGHVVVIGGYESGIDIACHHVRLGASATVVDPACPWEGASTSDPSFRLAPRSNMRLAEALRTGRLTLVPASALAVSREPDGQFAVLLDDESVVVSDRAPISAVGFGPGLGPVAELFGRREDGWPLVDEDDQSTITPGLFLVGPALRHGGLKFCFVYKFRQRFAHVARVIGERAGKNCSGLEGWRAAGMLADDLSCCGAECAC